jgi:hypothetical protein
MVREYTSHKDNETLWWVRYVSKEDLERQDGSTPVQGNAFFYASDEQALQKRLAGWQRHIKHEGVVIQVIEQVPPGFNLHFSGNLPDIPKGARILTLVERIVG